MFSTSSRALCTLVTYIWQSSCAQQACRQQLSLCSASERSVGRAHCSRISCRLRQCTSTSCSTNSHSPKPSLSSSLSLPPPVVWSCCPPRPAHAPNCSASRAVIARIGRHRPRPPPPPRHLTFLTCMSVRASDRRFQAFHFSIIGQWECATRTRYTNSIYRGVHGGVVDCVNKFFRYLLAHVRCALPLVAAQSLASAGPPAGRDFL
jgi:hypothetical protein